MSTMGDKEHPRRPTSETSRPPRARRPSGGGWRHAREAPRRVRLSPRHVSLKRARACAGFVGHSKQPSSASDLPRRERVRSARPGPGDARADDASRRRSQPPRFRSAPRARPYPSFTDHFARRVFAAPPRTVPLALAMRATWTKLVNMVIRPPRAQYDPSECLPGPRFRIGGVAYRRVDVDLEGALGHLLRCSLYEPEIRGADPSPCVIYLHGNSGSRCDAVDAVRLSSQPASRSSPRPRRQRHLRRRARHPEVARRSTSPSSCAPRRGGRVDRVGIWGRSMGAVTASVREPRPFHRGHRARFPGQLPHRARVRAGRRLLLRLLSGARAAAIGARLMQLHQSARRVRHTRPGRASNGRYDALPRVVRARRRRRFHQTRAFASASRRVRRGEGVFRLRRRP